MRAFVIAWTIACVLLGTLVGWQVLELREAGDALDSAGRGLERTAASLEELSDLPLVGDGIAQAAESVDDGGAAARSSAADIRTALVLLAILAGGSIALLPTVPLIAMLRLLRSMEAVGRNGVRAP